MGTLVRIVAERISGGPGMDSGSEGAVGDAPEAVGRVNLRPEIDEDDVSGYHLPGPAPSGATLQKIALGLILLAIMAGALLLILSNVFKVVAG
jgi:hypothetical protein